MDTLQSPQPAAAGTGQQRDLIIVGAGFAGLYMLQRARRMGLSARVFEAGSGVGGTWFWNRYPGARCDVDSLEYSYQFDDELQQQWKWSERYATQPEILRYANHVADRFNLRNDIQFNTRVKSAVFDEAASRWTVTTSDGSAWSGQFLIMATGCLSSFNKPNIPGVDRFEGKSYFTGEWPQQPVDFTGQRVGVIGTGSSAIQAIPIIAEQAKQLTVFQRTANYSVPARNSPIDPDYEATVRADYAGFRQRNSQMINAFGSNTPRSLDSALDASPEERNARFEALWQAGGLMFLRAFGDLMLNEAANKTAADFVRNKIRSIVKDPATAELLCPTQAIGCKRLCADTNYYATFNRPNVKLVDVRAAPIDEITPRGIRIGDTVHEFDTIVYATGFDAMTGSLARIDIRGRNGRPLADAWHAGPRTYLGLGVPGFPNLFTVSGPGSPSVLTNMIVSIEQHVNWIGDCIGWLRAHGKSRIEATEPAVESWVNHVNAVADQTLYPTCNSWYLGANVPGKTRVFMPLIGYPLYVEKCDQVAAQDYQGFVAA